MIQVLPFYFSTLAFLLWLTVVSKEEQDGVELVLEPIGFEHAKTYQKALFEAGIPLTAFHVVDIEKEYQRLINSGVIFSMIPTPMGTVKLAVFNETGKAVQEVSKIIHVRGGDENTVDLLAAAIGKTAPEIQDSVLVGRY